MNIIKPKERGYIRKYVGTEVKEKIRRMQDKTLFYLTHSKYATYADTEFLRYYEEELISSNAYIRLFQKNMSGEEKDPVNHPHINFRGQHSLDVAQQSENAAHDAFLNERLAKVGGMIHDIGHTCQGHEGEYEIAQYLAKKGICEIHHCALSVLMIRQEQIAEKALERYKMHRASIGKPLTQKEIKQCIKTSKDIEDIALCHDGESNRYEYTTNRSKTNDQVTEEFIKNFVVKGFNRKTIGRTPEALIVRMCDLIAYIPKDTRDGIIRGFINENDPKLKNILEKFGYYNYKTNTWAKEKDKIRAIITHTLNKDLSKNSINVDGIRMSEEIANLMYELRDYNYKESVSKALSVVPKKEHKFKLIDLYYNDLYGKGEKKAKRQDIIQAMEEDFEKYPESINKLYKQIVSRGIGENVKLEVEELVSIINGKEPKQKTEPTERRKRMQEDLEKIKDKNGKIDENTKKAYIDRVLKEINLTPEESFKILKRRIKNDNPDIDETQLEQMQEEKSYLRFETIEESINRLKITIYLAESTNDFMNSLLHEEEFITREEYDNRYVYSGDSRVNNSLLINIEHQKEEKAKQGR